MRGQTIVQALSKAGSSRKLTETGHRSSVAGSACARGGRKACSMGGKAASGCCLEW